MPEPDFYDPLYQNTPSSAAILSFLRTSTPHFTAISEELTEAEWTAFRALTKAGAVQGIVRFSEEYDDPAYNRTDYHRVSGDYISAMPDDPILGDAAIDLQLIRIRLTEKGERWKQYLSAESSQDQQRVRGFVLTLVWEAEPTPGAVRKVPPPGEAKERELNDQAQSRQTPTKPSAKLRRFPDHPRLTAFDNALIRLLCTIPDHWSSLPFDKFTQNEEKALSRLTEAGLVEQRVTAWARMDGFPQQIHLRCRVTGDFKKQLRLEALNAVPEWLDEDKRTRGRSVFKYDLVEVRLTDEGELARRDWNSPEPSFVLALVRGEGPHGPRGIKVRGQVKVEECRTTCVDASDDSIEALPSLRVSSSVPEQQHDDWGQSRDDDKWRLEKLADDMDAWWEACMAWEPVEEGEDEKTAFEKTRQSMVLHARLINLEQRCNEIVTALKLHGHVSVALDLKDHFYAFFQSAHRILTVCTKGRQNGPNSQEDIEASRVAMEITRDFFWLVKGQLDNAGLMPELRSDRCGEAEREVQGEAGNNEDSGTVQRPSLGVWSKPHGLKEWSKVFGKSVNTMRRWFKNGNVKNRGISPRQWQVAVDDLPYGYESNPDFVDHRGNDGHFTAC